MRDKVKRFISILMTALMLVNLLPVGATAAPAAEIMAAVVPISSLSAVIKAKMVYHNISC